MPMSVALVRCRFSIRSFTTRIAAPLCLPIRLDYASAPLAQVARNPDLLAQGWTRCQSLLLSRPLSYQGEENSGEENSGEENSGEENSEPECRNTSASRDNSVRAVHGATGQETVSHHYLVRLIGTCCIFGAPGSSCAGRNAPTGRGDWPSPVFACQHRCFSGSPASQRGPESDGSDGSNGTVSSSVSFEHTPTEELDDALLGLQAFAAEDSASAGDTEVLQPVRANTEVRQVKPKSDAEITNNLKQLIKTRKVVVFLKGSPDKPQCGFSKRTVDILVAVGCSDFTYVDVLKSPRVRELIKKYSGWPTIPQLYVAGEFVGGCDVVTELFQSGELVALFAKHNALFPDRMPKGTPNPESTKHAQAQKESVRAHNGEQQTNTNVNKEK